MEPISQVLFSLEEETKAWDGANINPDPCYPGGPECRVAASLPLQLADLCSYFAGLHP